MPGTEEGEAFKEALRRMVRHSIETHKGEASTDGVRRALQEYEAWEAESFARFPDTPHWAMQ